MLNRLGDATGPWGSISYSYDAVGNRLGKSVEGGSTVSYSYDSMDRLVSATGMGFSWDANGNLLYMDDGVYAWNYTYDPLNRLFTVYKDSVPSARYMYDAGGRRVRSWGAVDGVIDYVYSGLNVIDEVRGGAHEKYVFAGGMRIASNTTGSVEYYHVDHLGSTRLKTDADGAVIYTSNYEPYGPGVGESGGEEFRYTGKQEDPTGLYYFGARYYDPVTGRFTTRDSMFGDLSDPQSLNRYVYCRNNPHKYTDPDGRWSLQIGVGVSWTGLLGWTGLSGGVSSGLTVSLHEETGRLEVGWYHTEAIGIGFGVGGGISSNLEININKFDKSIIDVEGTSSTTMAEARIEAVNIGFGPTYSVDEKGIFDTSHYGLCYRLGVGTGLGVGLVTEASTTVVYTIYSGYPFGSGSKDVEQMGIEQYRELRENAIMR